MIYILVADKQTTDSQNLYPC